MHAVDDESLFNGVFGDHLMESVVESENCLWIGLEFKVFILTIFKNQWVFRGYCVIRLSGILLNTQKIFDNFYTLRSLSDHEQDSAHEPDLMP